MIAKFSKGEKKEAPKYITKINKIFKVCFFNFFF